MTYEDKAKQLLSAFHYKEPALKCCDEVIDGLAALVKELGPTGVLLEDAKAHIEWYGKVKQSIERL